MEHIAARIILTEFEYSALALHQGNGVSVLVRRQACPRWVIMEKVGVQVKRVNRVELQHIDQKNSHGFADFDLDGIPVVVERNGIDHIKVVLRVKVNVEG